MAIKCPDCRSLTVNHRAAACFVCGRKFRAPGEVPPRLLLIAGLLGVILTVILVAAEKLFATR